MHVPNSSDTRGGGLVTQRSQKATGGTRGGEFAAIERLRSRLPGPPAGELWIGDDAAVLVPRVGGDGKVLFTTDMAVAGVHGDLELIGLDDLGWRAMAGALSDIAAMGGRADGAVVAVGGPPDTDLDLLYDGVAGAADAHGCPVVGGDLSNADQVVVAVAVTGHVAGPPGPVTRRGARPADHVFVTGPLGSSAATLPRPAGAAGGGRGVTGPGRRSRAGSRRGGGSPSPEGAPGRR